MTLARLVRRRPKREAGLVAGGDDPGELGEGRCDGQGRLDPGGGQKVRGWPVTGERPADEVHGVVFVLIWGSHARNSTGRTGIAAGSGTVPRAYSPRNSAASARRLPPRPGRRLYGVAIAPKQHADPIALNHRRPGSFWRHQPTSGHGSPPCAGARD